MKFVAGCIAVGMTLAVANLVGAQTPETSPATTAPAIKPAKLPDAIAKAQDEITKWVNTLYGKTEEEIVKELGEPGTRGKDRDGDLVMTYPTSARGKLTLYFSKRQRVILASYNVMSD